MYKDQEHFTLIYCSRILSPTTFWKIISELSAQLDFRHLMMHLTIQARDGTLVCVPR